MSRRITANLYMTLDGRGAFPKSPGFGQSHERGQRLLAGDVDRSVRRRHHRDHGSRSFTGHRRVWTEKARKPSNPQDPIDYSRWLDHVQKVCLSNRLKTPGWENSRVMKGDLSKIVAKLKREKGGNIIAEGGPRRSSSSSGGTRGRLLVSRAARGLWEGAPGPGSDEEPGDPQAPLIEDPRGRRIAPPLRNGSKLPPLARCPARTVSSPHADSTTASSKAAVATSVGDSKSGDLASGALL